MIVSVMWGDWHVGVFLDVNLPTMLASGNLPALAARVEVEYLLFTTVADASRMAADPGFQRLQQLVNLRVETFELDPSINPMALHHDYWRRGIARAKDLDAFILTMPPDVLWADGSFARLADALAAGKQAIFMTYPRVVSETLLPDFLARFRRGADSTLPIPADEMMRLALVHLHPLTAAHGRSSTHFTLHPEMVVWPIEGDGLLIRVAARELFCFKPDRYALTAQALLAELPPEEHLHVFQDSREFLGLSLTPFWKDTEWYLRPARFDPLHMARWWLYYDSPFNDYISRLDMRFGSAPQRDEPAWRRASQSADRLFAHVRVAREFVRLLLLLAGRPDHGMATDYLAAALRIHGLARRWPARGPFLILVPTDAALLEWGHIRFPGDSVSRADVMATLKAYVAPLPPQGFRSGRDVTTLAGSTVRIPDSAFPTSCGANTVCFIDHLLHVQDRAD